jgi:hypothetical protein
MEMNFPFLRVTLNIEIPLVINKTNKKSFPRIWSINDFIDAAWNIRSKDKAVTAIQKLLREFVKNH